MMADDFDVESLLEATYNRDNAKNNTNRSDYKKFDSSDGYSENENRQSNRNGRNDTERDSDDNDEVDSDSNMSVDRKKSHKHKDRRHRSRSRHSSQTKHKSRSIHKRSKSRSPLRSSKHKSSKKSRHESRSKSRHRSNSKSRGHSKSESTSHHRRSSRSRSKHESVKAVESRHKSSSSKHRSSKSPHKRHRSGSRNRSVHSKSKDHRPSPPRSASRDKRKRHSLTPLNLPGRKPHLSPPFSRYRRYSPSHTTRPPADDLSPEERDARTIFVMQLSQRIRSKDLEEFFSSVGKVRDVRLITCNKTRRFKGIAYIEFVDPESVALALGLNGQKLLDIPIIVQPTQAEKNRVGNTMPNVMNRIHPGPTRLYVGSLHFNITEDMLRGIFEPFGKIDSIQLVVDPETNRSKGYGFVTYHNSDDAKKALEQMNGFELAGRPMKVNNVTEKHEFTSQSGGSSLDTDELDRAGIDLGATGRLQLMYKLAEGTGMEIPPAAASALNLNQIAQGGQPLISAPTPPITTQCFMLSNMFDPTVESQTNWDVEIMDDVIEECNKHGGCVHVFVDKSSPQGNVYVKCATIMTAAAAVNSLHGRWFGGRIITAAYVPVLNYHNLFPETITANTLLTTYRTM